MATSTPIQRIVRIAIPDLQHVRRVLVEALEDNDEGVIAYWASELLVLLYSIEMNRLDQAKSEIDLPRLRTLAAQVLRISGIVEPRRCAVCKCEMFSGKDSSGRHLICLTCGIRVEIE